MVESKELAELDNVQDREDYVNEMLHHHLFFGARWSTAFFAIVAISLRTTVRVLTFLLLLVMFIVLLYDHSEFNGLLELAKDISPTYLFVIVAYYTMEKARDIY